MRCWTGLTACIATVMLAAARGDMIVCSRGLRAQVCGYAERATTIRLSEGRIQPLVCDLVWCSAYGKAVPRYACQYMKHGARSSSRAASLTSQYTHRGQMLCACCMLSCYLLFKHNGHRLSTVRKVPHSTSSFTRPYQRTWGRSRSRGVPGLDLVCLHGSSIMQTLSAGFFRCSKPPIDGVPAAARWRELAARKRYDQQFVLCHAAHYMASGRGER
jgi:hypothetical protein